MQTYLQNFINKKYTLGSNSFLSVIAKLWLIFIIGSFLGFCYETLNDLICGRGLMLRLNLIGPWCPIYGIGCTLIVMLFGSSLIKGKHGKIRARTPIFHAISIILLVNVVELLGSYVCEYLTGYCPWDYSDYFMNFEGRIALRTTLIFLIGGMFVLYFIFPKINNFVNNSKKSSVLISMILLLLFLLDQFLEVNGVNSNIKSCLITSGSGFITIQGL